MKKILILCFCSLLFSEFALYETPFENPWKHINDFENPKNLRVYN